MPGLGLFGDIRPHPRSISEGTKCSDEPDLGHRVTPEARKGGGTFAMWIEISGRIAPPGGNTGQAANGYRTRKKGPQVLFLWTRHES